MNILSKAYNSLLHGHVFGFSIFVIFFSFFVFAGALIISNDQVLKPSDSHLVDLYVDGQQSTIPTRAATVADVLKKTNVTLFTGDIVEPAAETQIDADNFRITVYRARPVTVHEGTTYKKILTAQTSPVLIAQAAGITLYPEDKTTTTTTDTFINNQAFGELLTIERATPVTVSLYGTPAAPYRTHVKTVKELFKEVGIVPEKGSTVTPKIDTALVPNQAIFVSKPGKTVAFVESDVAFETETTPDPTKTSGVVTVQKPGVKGKKQIVYELEIKNGKEVSRRKIQEVITVLPIKQIQSRGTKPGSGLSKARGALVSTDSKGVMHRETYYDLPMNSVMRSCGGGTYTIREDGAKVDKDGYILVAANLAIYPRCSIVETSIGLGKVYDTGGFVLVHPHGFDLATDWSNNDGR